MCSTYINSFCSRFNKELVGIIYTNKLSRDHVCSRFLFNCPISDSIAALVTSSVVPRFEFAKFTLVTNAPFANSFSLLILKKKESTNHQQESKKKGPTQI